MYVLAFPVVPVDRGEPASYAWRFLAETPRVTSSSFRLLHRLRAARISEGLMKNGKAVVLVVEDGAMI